MTKAEAAKFLKVSEKTISRYIERGRLTATKKQGKTGLQLDLDSDELQQLKDELQTPVEVTPKLRQETGQDSNVLARLDSPQNTSQIEALANLVRAVLDAGQGEGGQGKTGHSAGAVHAVPIESRLTLDLDGAALLSGFSKGTIRAAIASGSLPAKKIGKGWKVERGALDEWVRSLFNSDKTAEGDK